MVIACNTASTLVLPPLRERFAVPFVGTVPAIKPAAEQTKSGVVAVLATPGTMKRDYTRELIRSFAQSCHVRLVGAPELARLAEARMRGEPVDREAIANQIAPCFVEMDGRRTDIVVLACTHYPFLADMMAELGAMAGHLARPGAGDRPAAGDGAGGEGGGKRREHRALHQRPRGAGAARAAPRGKWAGRCVGWARRGGRAVPTRGLRQRSVGTLRFAHPTRMPSVV